WPVLHCDPYPEQRKLGRPSSWAGPEPYSSRVQQRHGLRAVPRDLYRPPTCPNDPERPPRREFASRCSLGGTIVRGRVALRGVWWDGRIEWGGLGQLCSWREDAEVFQPPYLREDIALQRGKQAVVPDGGGRQGVAQLLQIGDEGAETAVEFGS